MLIVSTVEDVTTVGDVEGVDGVFDVDQVTGEHLLAFTGWRLPTEDEVAAFLEAANADEPDESEVDEVAPLKGAALAEALTDAGLPKTGTADEKRARVAENEG
jgi:predicted dehydrogenase